MIATNEDVDRLIPRLRQAAWIGLDTEADSLHHYPERLCLVQLSFPGEAVLLDPLAGIDLAPVWEVLGRRELILHGGDYDLRMLNRAEGFVPARVFDTMLAARLLGHREFGLVHLVRAYLGVELHKAGQKANWSRRPLNEKLRIYALNDARYLWPLADALRKQLEAKGRSSWHEEACERLVSECSQLKAPDPDEVWRLRGNDRLGRRGLAVLRELWHWREQEAVAHNRPPFFILPHDWLLTLAGAAEADPGAEIELPRFLPRRRTRGIREALQRAVALPESSWPALRRRRGKRPTPEERRLADTIRARRDRVAAALGLDPTLIASKATLTALGRDNGAAAVELMAWQRHLLELPDGNA